MHEGWNPDAVAPPVGDVYWRTARPVSGWRVAWLALQGVALAGLFLWLVRTFG